MTRLSLTILAAAAILAGCASSKPQHACTLDSAEGGACASMQDAYKASRRMTSNPDATRVQSVFDSRVQQNGADSAKPYFSGQPSNYPEPGQTGMPIFTQPKVMRVWVAPYVDADGNLRSGEYTYFSTPGTWNYGTLNKPGAASGIMEPSRPDNLGFKPNTTPTQPARRAAPPAPAEADNSGTNAGQQPAAQGQAPRQQSSNSSSEGITQPYRRLAN